MNRKQQIDPLRGKTWAQWMDGLKIDAFLKPDAPDKPDILVPRPLDAASDEPKQGGFFNG